MGLRGTSDVRRRDFLSVFPNKLQDFDLFEEAKYEVRTQHTQRARTARAGFCGPPTRLFGEGRT